MFVAWQAERTRVVRRLFVAACLIPCAAVAGWAAWRHGTAHRDALRASLEAALGTGLSIGRVEHLRPGCVRLERLAVHDDRGQVVFRLDAAELEWSAGEVRFRTPDLDLDPAVAAIAATAARDWLAEPWRHPRDVVVEIGRLRPAAASGPGEAPLRGLRAECVAAPTGRAVRVRSEPEGGEGLVVQAFAGDGEAAPRVEARGVVVAPIPVGVVAALLDWPALRDASGPAATLSGTLETTTAEGGLGGNFTGVLDGVDLASCTRGLPFRAEGAARVEIERCRIERGRLTELRATVEGGAGRVDLAALAALARALGARPAAAWPVRGAEVVHDRLRVRIDLDATGLHLRGGEGGAIVSRGGVSILDAPREAVPVDRLAWALSPPGAVPVPASAVTGWLLSVLPMPTATDAAHAPLGASRR